MRNASRLSAAICALSLCTLAVAQSPTPKSAPQKPAAAVTATAKRTQPLPIEEHRLKNGLRVILSPDHSAPTYAISITYNVGSRNEREGRTGFAHLFEHMMFQGSENVGKGEHFLLVQNNGGSMNGTTNEERTNYFESLPANQLDLGLFLEADRMKSLAVTQANLDNQRNAVQEERRLGVDNQPYGKTEEKIQELAFDNFAYKHDTIGSMKDLDAATLEDVQQFFKTYYAPNNATLTLVGDFDSKVALAKVEQYFGAIPAQAQPAQPDVTEPKQTAERRAELEDGFAQAPRLDIVFKAAPGNTPDYYAVDTMLDVLATGQSSRLYQKLVKEKELAVQVYGMLNEHRGPSLADIMVIARPGADLAAIEKIVYEELDMLQKNGPTAAELERVRLRNRRQIAQSRLSTLFRAISIGQYTTFYNNPQYVNNLEANYDHVSAANVQAVAAKYFTPTARTVVTTVPKAASAATTATKPAQSKPAGQ